MASKRKKSHGRGGAGARQMRGGGARPPMAGGGAPMPGPNEFSAGDEQAMRQGAASARLAPPPMVPDADADMM